jgi:hypothetical protein
MIANVAITKNESDWFAQVAKALAEETNETYQHVKDR